MADFEEAGDDDVCGKFAGISTPRRLPSRPPNPPHHGRLDGAGDRPDQGERLTWPFTLARRLRAGETVYTGWCALASPIVAETLAREGFAAVTIDKQHGLWDAAHGHRHRRHHGRRAPDRARALSTIPMVSRVLDFGAEGVIAPLINTADAPGNSWPPPSFRRSASAAGARTVP